MKKLLLPVFVCIAVLAHSQNVGINTGNGGSTTPNASAILDLNSNNNFASPNGKGLLIPNVALASITDAVTIASPATSLMVYNTGAGGLTPSGIYYNAGTPASPNWVDINKTHVVLSEALQPPNPLASGDGQSFGYGGWLITWSSGAAIDFHVLSNPGEGAYYATSAQTIYNLMVNGWALNDDHSAFTTNITIYLMKYSLGTADVANWTTHTLTGTVLGSQALTIDPTNNAAGEYDVEPFSMNIGTVTLAKGDILIMWMASNNVGTYLYYGQAQLEFDQFH
jgi:hypothetical protein